MLGKASHRCGYLIDLGGNITFHTARSAAYPQPKGGEGMGPGPLSVPLEQLPSYLGVTSVRVNDKSLALALTDTSLG